MRLPRRLRLIAVAVATIKVIEVRDTSTFSTCPRVPCTNAERRRREAFRRYNRCLPSGSNSAGRVSASQLAAAYRRLGVWRTVAGTSELSALGQAPGGPCVRDRAQTRSIEIYARTAGTSVVETVTNRGYALTNSRDHRDN